MGKRLLLLGGSRYLFPVIDVAHNMGIEVITADYLPNNIAHMRSDGYCNVSIVDKDAVLDCANSLRINGIMSFAADPGVVSAAYVAEKLGLPFQSSYEATVLLQSKDKFRTFLSDHNFNCPRTWFFSSAEEALKEACDVLYPVIVKPVDSAGSKGCSRVDEPKQLAHAVNAALKFSKQGRCIVEEFLEKACPTSDAESFTIDGAFDCVSFTSQFFDPDSPNPYAPAAFAMPAAMPMQVQNELKSELQRLSGLLGLSSGIYNVETRVAVDGKPYIMEISPRGGGNRLAEMLCFASGVNLIKASVQAALGMPIEQVVEPSFDKYWYQEILHSNYSGLFEKVWYAPGFYENHVVDEQLWVSPGERVEAFKSANYAFGSVVMKFETREEFLYFINQKDHYMKVFVK